MGLSDQFLRKSDPEANLRLGTNKDRSCAKHCKLASRICLTHSACSRDEEDEKDEEEEEEEKDKEEEEDVEEEKRLLSAS